MQQSSSSFQKIDLAQGRFSFIKQDLIGKGTTGNVYRGLDHKQNKHVAVKVIDTGKMNKVEKCLIQNQKKALRIIKHQNIMKVLHIEDHVDFTFIISQIYQGGSLKEYLEKRGKFGQQEAMEFFRKIISAYCEIVQANIIHRDLKPANILLSKSKEPIVIDFGYSQIIMANKNLTVFNVGSPSYMSPEAYNKTIYSQKSDIWSLGAIFYELLTNKTLDKDIPTKSYFLSLEKRQYPLIDFQAFSQVPKQILKGSLTILPQQRITAHKIKYLLDKEIIGRKINKKTIFRTDSNTATTGQMKFSNYDGISAKSPDFSFKQIDPPAARYGHNSGNMARKESSTQLFINFSTQLNDQWKKLQIPKSFINTKVNNILSSDKNIQAHLDLRKTISTNVTPTFGKIQLKRLQSQRDITSTINYEERKYNDENIIKTVSTLIYVQRQGANKQPSLAVNNFLNQNILNNAKYQNNDKEITNLSYSHSRCDFQNMTYSQGFYRKVHNENQQPLTKVILKKQMSDQTDVHFLKQGKISQQLNKKNCSGVSQNNSSYRNVMLNSFNKRISEIVENKDKINFLDLKNPQFNGQNTIYPVYNQNVKCMSSNQINVENTNKNQRIEPYVYSQKNKYNKMNFFSCQFRQSRSSKQKISNSKIVGVPYQKSLTGQTSPDVFGNQHLNSHKQKAQVWDYKIDQLQRDMRINQCNYEQIHTKNKYQSFNPGNFNDSHSKKIIGLKKLI